MCRTRGFARGAEEWEYEVRPLGARSGRGGAGEVDRGVPDGIGVLGGIGVFVGSAMVREVEGKEEDNEEAEGEDEGEGDVGPIEAVMRKI